MRIPVGRRIEATVEGDVTKRVTCEKCGCVFSYRMHRRATGEATSPLFLFGGSARARADKRADAALTKSLQTGHDMVTCPTCHHYQRAMVWAFKKMALMAFTIFAAIVLACSWFIPALLDKETKKGELPSYVWPPGLVVGVGLFVYAALVFAVYDPNTMKFPLFSRKQKGQMLSAGTISQPRYSSADAYASQFEQMPAEPPVELPPNAFIPEQPTTPEVVAVRCPHCSARFHAKSSAIGRRVKCKRCAQSFVALEDSETA